MELKDVIKFEARRDDKGNLMGRGNIVIASGYKESDVDELLQSTLKEYRGDLRAQQQVLAMTIVEPIQQVVPYAEMFDMFFLNVNYGDLDDNAIPVEDTVALAWETHADGGTEFVRVGSITWTRPSFQTWDYGIAVPWDGQRFIGWNFLARQMRRAAEALAKKRDAVARSTLNTAIVATSGHAPAVASTMTKASVDAIIKGSSTIGFPVTRALINTGTITDMATYLPSTVLAQYPQAVGEEILTNLFISNYGGIEWFANPYAPVGFVYFGGQPDQIGWHQTKGSIRTVSDVDIRNNRDLHKVLDAYNAWYVGNSWTLWRLTIN